MTVRLTKPCGGLLGFVILLGLLWPADTMRGDYPDHLQAAVSGWSEIAKGVAILNLTLEVERTPQSSRNPGRELSKIAWQDQLAKFEQADQCILQNAVGLYLLKKGAEERWQVAKFEPIASDSGEKRLDRLTKPRAVAMHLFDETLLEATQIENFKFA